MAVRTDGICEKCGKLRILEGGVTFLKDRNPDNEPEASDLYRCDCGLRWTRPIDFERDEILE